ncbi:ABC transporter permease [Rhodovarius crocodyli]|uniref:ABC transporter permease n=1 Tax=Rhodovarius crocodyli TaxID=1979269 RepID=A0A437M2A7_9PROT|nr:ABC transporter permease [Rhodovarius crocodyli]RVT91752.1 ABC transporter permease [Rhodovarius crocodyli]
MTDAALRIAIPEPRPRGAPLWLRRRPELVLTPLVFLVLVALWQAVAWSGVVSAFVLPAPSAIAASLVAGLRSGLFLQHGLVTLAEAAAGFAIAVAAGLVVGTLIAEIRLLERTVYPCLVAIQTMPKIALAPLLVVWFGFGPGSKIAVAAIISFFPMLVTTIAGLRDTDRGRLDVLLALGAAPLRCLVSAKLPGALPHVFSGLSIAAVFALTGAIVGEFVGASAGLGYLIVQANARLNIPQVFALLLVLGGIGVLAYGTIQALRRRLLFWAPKEERSSP